VPERATHVELDGRRLRLTNLDKVLYPAAGFTKAQVIDYYARIAPTMLPHLAARPLTFKRYPNGVDAPGFYEKNCPGHRPAWLDVMDGPGGVRSCHIDHPAGLVWAGNQAALEIHVPMALGADLDTPTILAFDLDPGEPADVVDCCRAALWVRDVLEAVGLAGFPKTSGSKGLQVYVPLNTPATHEQASEFALAVGQLLTRQHPDRILVDMTRSLRPGKVFVDWSQNNAHKTTVGVYSLRARSRPTVSTPLSWDEVDDATSHRDADRLTFETADVLARVEEHGDLFAPVLHLEQELPSLQAG
jgi:bifunctional non-homologous end joining protein LigD